MDLKSFGRALVLAGLAAFSASAQLAGGMTETSNLRLGGTISLAGTVFYPDGTPVNSRMMVRLRPSTSGEYTALTSSTGQFVFSGLTAGQYRVVLDSESDFEEASQDVDILPVNPLEMKPTYTVSIRLRDRVKNRPKPQVVAVSKAAERAMKAAPFYQKALELAKKNDHAGAVEQLKLAIAADPDNFTAHNEMAVRYMRLNDLEQADAAVRAALKLKPDSPEALLNRSIIDFRREKYTDAEATLRGLIGVGQASPNIHFYLGRTLTKLTKYDEAESQLHKAIETGGTEMNEAHRMLAMLFIDKDDRPKAIAAIESYLQLVPTAPDAANLRRAIAQLKGESPK